MNIPPSRWFARDQERVRVFICRPVDTPGHWHPGKLEAQLEWTNTQLAESNAPAPIPELEEAVQILVATSHLVAFHLAFMDDVSRAIPYLLTARVNIESALGSHA